MVPVKVQDPPQVKEAPREPVKEMKEEVKEPPKAPSESLG